jgi:hypothetical protein
MNPEDPRPPIVRKYASPGCGDFSSPRDLRSLRQFHAWLGVAMLAYLGATAAVRWRASLPGALVWVLIGLAWLLTLESLRRYLVFLRHTDELRRRIETEALALGFGAGAVVTLLYPLFEGMGGPRLDGTCTALVMMVAAVVGYWLGRRRYSGGDGA